MITKFILNNKLISSQYGLPFFYTGMCILVKQKSYEVILSKYDADSNEQHVVLKQI